MEALKLRPAGFYLLAALPLAAVAALEYGGLVPQRGTLLVTLAFWSALAQGAVALAAVTELVRARWVTGLRRELLCAYPLLLATAVLFLLWLPRLGLYPWAAEPGRWLNPSFFGTRNLVLLLAAFLLAALFARAAVRGERRRKTLAVLYLLVFVAAQSLVGFDLVMSLEYPWYSTLFGAFFFVEALYGGIALAAVAILLLHRGRHAAGDEVARKALRDIGFLLLGFCVLWGGLFFAQYLLLWYGNLPAEVGFIAERTAPGPLAALAVLVLVANFAVPFLALLSRRLKQVPAAVATVALVILAGLFLERVLYVAPAAPLHGGLLVVENLLLGGIWLVALHSRHRLLPGAGERDAGRPEVS